MQAENRSKEHRWRVYCDCGFVSNGYASYNDCEDKRVTHLRSHTADSGGLPDSDVAAALSSEDATRPTGDKE